MICSDGQSWPSIRSESPTCPHAAHASGFTGLAVDHIDVLAGLDQVTVGHAYTLDGAERLTMPTTTERWADCEPTFRAFDGRPAVDWGAVAASGYDAIPENARAYLAYIADEVGASIYAVGVEPGRERTTVLEELT